MIGIRISSKSFASTETERIWNGQRSRSLSLEVQRIGRRKLRMINNAQDLRDLRIPLGNRLEQLKGDRAGQHSVRINRQYRIFFRWEDGDAYDIEIVDYY